jgi:opacity protein-like surface antigen
VGARVAIAPWSSRRLSLEFDVSRTLSSAPLNPKANHGSPTIASAQVGYYFSDGRVQPFLGGGIGMVWSSLHRQVAPPADERPANGTWNFGGGARIRLTRAISFRPEFRWYTPAPIATYRVSFALAYGW